MTKKRLQTQYTSGGGLYEGTPVILCVLVLTGWMFSVMDSQNAPSIPAASFLNQTVGASDPQSG